MDATLVSSFESGVTAIQSDVVDLLIVVVPLALVLFGTILAIRYGKRAFRMLAR